MQKMFRDNENTEIIEKYKIFIECSRKYNISIEYSTEFYKLNRHIFPQYPYHQEF